MTTYKSIIPLLIIDSILITIIIAFTCIDIYKNRNTRVSYNDSSVSGTVLSSLSNILIIKRGIAPLLMQLLIAAFVIGRLSWKIFIALEIAVIPIIFIYIRVDILKSNSEKISKLFNTSKIIGLIVFLYSKFLLVMMIYGLYRRHITIQDCSVLFILIEAFGIYVLVRYVIIGIGEKLQPAAEAADGYTNLSFLLSDIRVKHYLFLAISGTALNFCSGFLPYLMKPGVRILGDILLIFFMTYCFVYMKRWSAVRIIVLIGSIGAVASLCSNVVFASSELQVLFKPLYKDAYIILAQISCLTLFALPLALILSKMPIFTLKALSYAATAYGLFYTLFLYIFEDSRMFLYRYLNKDIFEISNMTYVISQLLFLFLLSYLATLKQRPRIFTDDRIKSLL